MAKQILVVEDNPVLLKLISELLRKKGYSVRTVEDGLSALNVLEQYIPDIIFVDLIIPKIKGETLCRIIRSKKQFDNTFIIIISGIAAEADLDFKDLKVSACIAKGKNLINHINEVLLKVEQGEFQNGSQDIFGLRDVFLREAVVGLLDCRKHFEVILRNLSEGLVEVTPDGDMIFANTIAEELLSLSQNQLLGKSFFELLGLKEKLLVVELFKQAHKQKVIESQPIPLGTHQVILKICALEKNDNPPCIIIIHDVTERMEIESALKKSEEQFRAIFESSRDCILVWDRDYNYLYANRAAIDHVGTTKEQVIGKNMRDGLGHIPDFMHLWMERVDTVFKDNQVLRVEDMVPVGDQFIYSESVISPIQDGEGDTFAVGVVYRDTTERAAYEKQLEKAATTDPLTSLLNRRAISILIKDEITRVNRNNMPFSILLADIDDFKLINDRYGHDAGDDLLVAVAKLLRSTLREQDSVARWGGEEFLLFLPETDLSGAANLAGKIRSELKSHQLQYVDHTVQVTMTFGVSEFSPSLGIDETIKQADEKLYRGKRSGKNCVITV